MATQTAVTQASCPMLCRWIGEPARRRRPPRSRRRAGPRRPPRPPHRSAACTSASGVCAGDPIADTGEPGQADARVDAVVRRGCGRRRAPRPRARARGSRCAAPSPPGRRLTSRVTGAAGRYASALDQRSAGPPSAATMRPNVSAAAPLASAASMRAAALRGSLARPPSTSISAPSATHDRHEPGVAARAGQIRSSALRTSSALPAALASGSSMSVISATVGSPAPIATRAR